MGVRRSTPITTAVRAQLRAIGKTDEPQAKAALAYAARLDDPATPATAVAAIGKELRATLAELVRNAPAVADPVDELRQRREARRRGA